MRSTPAITRPGLVRLSLFFFPSAFRLLAESNDCTMHGSFVVVVVVVVVVSPLVVVATSLRLGSELESCRLRICLNVLDAPYAYNSDGVVARVRPCITYACMHGSDCICMVMYDMSAVRTKLYMERSKGRIKRGRQPAFWGARRSAQAGRSRSQGL